MAEMITLKEVQETWKPLPTQAETELFLLTCGRGEPL
jgi:hypothetical protein